jgi:hypothetical protein
MVHFTFVFENLYAKRDLLVNGHHGLEVLHSVGETLYRHPGFVFPLKL